VARIVYIDDEEALREIVAEILSAVGHEIVLAGTGLEGVEAVRRERPDLVLCDVNMAGLDGYGVLQAIRQDPRLSSIPFLFLTSLDAQGHVRAGMVVGADDYGGRQEDILISRAGPAKARAFVSAGRPDLGWHVDGVSRPHRSVVVGDAHCINGQPRRCGGDGRVGDNAHPRI